MAQCPICEENTVEPVLELRNIPVYCNALYRTAGEARAAPRGDLTLGFCAACGHGVNLSFDPGLMDYKVNYENSLHYSQTFQRYAKALVSHLARRYRLQGKTVLEIGSGRGDFLRLFCGLAKCKGIGLDPSLDKIEGSGSANNPLFLPEPFRKDHLPGPVDLVICRHVLEHVAEPSLFVREIASAVGEESSAAGYFEVPSLEWIVERGAVWDLIYEHPQYFSLGSLRTLFERWGYTTERLEREYGGQYLAIEVIFGEGLRGEARSLPATIQVSQVRSFAAGAQEVLSRWRSVLRPMLASGTAVAIWGIGSKAISFLNLLELGEEPLWLVDQNPRKVGKYAAGTGLRIHSPEELRSFGPEVVLVANSLYLGEIRGSLSDMGLKPQLLSIL